MTTRRRGLVVVNPAARGGAAGMIGDVLARCEPRLDLEVVRTTARGEAVARVASAVAAARAGGPPLCAVIALGGDGTVREAAEGLARGLGRFPRAAAELARGEPAPALAIVPAGTGNSVYRALWGDEPWEETLARAVGSPGGSVPRAVGSPGRATRVRNLDLGRIVETDSAFLLGASAGLLRRIVEVAAGLDHLSGRERYAAAALAAIADLRAFPGRAVVDGAVLFEGAATMMVAGGARHRGGAFQLLPRSVLDDGLLDVCVIRDLSQTELQEIAPLVFAGEHLGRAEVSYAQGRRVVFDRADGPLPFEADGDLWEGSERSLTLEVVPGAVPVWAPAEPVAG
ncbi:MAG: diacylglycerol kinase [Acidobacteria bacterium]|nr:diacylglycerol kinase [Acidobacteriota bacterium]